MKHSKVLFAAFLAYWVAVPLFAVETAFWQVGSFDEFLEGTLSGISVSKEGDLKLAPEARNIFNPEEALALSLAGDQRNLYIGTGHQGKVFRLELNKDVKASPFFTAREPDVFAMAVGPDGDLYVASSPEGKIYRVSPDGKSTVFYEPKAKYIWAIAFDAQGRLYAGTGDRGQILRVDRNGKGEIFFDSKQTHIMCLTLDRHGNVVAGSDPNGLIYRITPQGKAFVLYQSNLPEIHEVVTDSEGRIYAAALGGTGGKGTPELFATPSAPAGELRATTTITVTGSDETRTPGLKADTSPAVPSYPPSFNRPAPGLGLPQGLQGRGSLIEILPDYSAEPIWSSNTESIFGLALRGKHVVFSTDSNGRIFDLDTTRDGERLTLLAETRESLATRLFPQGPELYIATSNVARLFRMSSNAAREGSYESSVKDTKFISHWGVVAWRGDVPPASAIELFTRSGNSDRADHTWSDWAGPYMNPDGSKIQSPPARYIQWKAVLRGSNNASPALDEVTVSYINQNLPPQIRSLSVSTGAERTGLNVASSAPASGSSVSVNNSGAFGGSSSSAGGTRTPIVLNWQADDPNGDQLVYSLYIKAADEQQWHLLKDKLRQTTYPLEPSTLADGKYTARLVASDEESNPQTVARTTEMISPPFWIDNTPPQVQVIRQTETAGACEIRFRVEDSVSPLRSAEVAIDGQEWRGLYSDDGVVDSRLETFTVTIHKLDPGEHIVTLRAYDTAGNAGVGKAVVRLPQRVSANH
jgi:hypothetical protein